MTQKGDRLGREEACEKQRDPGKREEAHPLTAVLAGRDHRPAAIHLRGQGSQIADVCNSCVAQIACGSSSHLVYVA